MSPRLLYRTVAIAEAVTWTLLITGMLLKYAATAGSLPVVVAGSVHGLVTPGPPGGRSQQDRPREATGRLDGVRHPLTLGVRHS